MLASRDDLIQCYRLVLKRDPESEEVMSSRLASSPTLWKVIADLLDSDERKTLEKVSYGFSFEKCVKDNYLTKNLNHDVGLSCFTNNIDFLRERLPYNCFLDLMRSKLLMYKFENNNAVYTVDLRFPRVIVNEGELSLRFTENNAILYQTHFSFIKGRTLRSSQNYVMLISRIQGQVENAALLKAATKAAGDLAPKTFLLSILQGIAEANDIKEIYGVEATNQVCYSESKHSIFYHAYDEFFQASGFTGPDSGFYKLDLPVQHKPLTKIASWHRLRSKKKRQLRQTISETARDAWIALMDRRVRP